CGWSFSETMSTQWQRPRTGQLCGTTRAMRPIAQRSMYGAPQRRPPYRMGPLCRRSPNQTRLARPHSATPTFSVSPPRHRPLPLGEGAAKPPVRFKICQASLEASPYRARASRDPHPALLFVAAFGRSFARPSPRGRGTFLLNSFGFYISSLGSVCLNETEILFGNSRLGRCPSKARSQLGFCWYFLPFWQCPLPHP